MRFASALSVLKIIELMALRARAKISSQLWVLRRPAGKARKRRNIQHIPSLRNADRRDAWAPKM
jgi:hypothetical protein